jgi:hypothetical protein
MAGALKCPITVRVVIGAGFNERHYQPTPKPAHLLKINKIVRDLKPYTQLSRISLH